MKKINENERRIWHFLFGLFIGWAIMAIMAAVFIGTTPETQQCPSQNYNEYTGYEMCQRNCGKYNSTSIHAWSWIDSKWHCSCVSGNETALLW